MHRIAQGVLVRKQSWREFRALLHAIRGWRLAFCEKGEPEAPGAHPVAGFRLKRTAFTPA
jgi:hypothetical protein